MKIAKRLIIWIMISLLLQFAGLFYIDRYYLGSGNTKIKARKVTNDSKEEKKVDISIPEGVEKLKVSFDGKYISYFKENNLNIVNTKTGKEKQLSFDDIKDVSTYTWLSDRNRLLYAEKKDGTMVLNSYDVEREQNDKIKKFDSYGQGDKIEDIQAAPLTSVIYVKIKRESGTHSVYNLNIMKQKTKKDLMCDAVGNIRIVPHEDTLVYENNYSGKVYATNLDHSINLPNVEKAKLLSIDDNDNVYIGNLKDKKITKIYYGSLNDSASTWKSLDVPNGAEIKDIYVSSMGKVYLNDNLKGIVTELETGKTTKYTGVMGEMYIDGITSILDRKLIKTKFN